MAIRLFLTEIRPFKFIGGILPKCLNNIELKTFLLQGLSEPEFYGDLVYKFRKISGKNNFFIISKK